PLRLLPRDEEATRPPCPGPVADLFEEVIVVDTAPTDRTREVAQRFGARVLDFPWRDDFAAARNAAIERATGRWIFWMDADDRLDEANRQRLRDLLHSLPDDLAADLVRCVSATAAGTSVTAHIRLSPTHPAIRWQYRVHEQILPALRRLGVVVRPSGVAVWHTGYEEPAVHRRKQERNLRLLLQEQEERPDDPQVL